MSKLPSWLSPEARPSWPTARVASAELGYALELPARWDPQPTSTQHGNVAEHVYRGGLVAEWLTIARMSGANPAADLRGWFEATQSMIGCPSEHLLRAGEERPRTLAWDYLGEHGAALPGLGVDELHAYGGQLTLVEGKRPELARAYGL